MSDYFDLITLAKQSTQITSDRTSFAYGAATNTSCGDSCEIWAKIDGENILAVEYDAKGCVISRAAAAVLAVAAIGPIGPIEIMNGDEIRKLLSVPVSPLRERCLTTALAALQNALNSYET